MEPAKRVNIVSVKLIKESSMLYKQRRVRSPQDSYELFQEYLGEVDREHFVVMCLDTKNQPTKNFYSPHWQHQFQHYASTGGYENSYPQQFLFHYLLLHIHRANEF